MQPKDNLPLAIWLHLRKDLRQKHRPYTPRIAECMGVELPGAWRHLDAKSSADFGTFHPLQDLPAMKAISLTPAIYYDYKGYHGYCCLLLIYDAMITYDGLFSFGAVMFAIVIFFFAFVGHLGFFAHHMQKMATWLQLLAGHFHASDWCGICRTILK